jgi:L-lactate dehydrogenase complex protein LldG
LEHNASSYVQSLGLASSLRALGDLTMDTPVEGLSLPEAFSERARAVAAQVSTVPGLEAAAQIIAAGSTPAAGRHTATAALISAYPSLRDLLSGHGVEVSIAEEIAAAQKGPSATAAALQGGTGLVLAAWGVAETGSFLSVEETLAARLLGMLADSVFAILPSDKIVPGLDEIGAILSQLQVEGRRYVSLITGPSRTADIERVLTIGVQGPKSLHVIVLAAE